MGFLIRVLVLAFVWAALQGSFSGYNILLGLLIGGVVVWFMRPLYDLASTRDPSVGGLLEVRPLTRVWRFIVLVFVFLWELVLSSISVAREIIRPTLKIQPGVIAYPLDVQTGREITALANLISLTPGTLSLDVSNDRTVIYIHSMFVSDNEATEVRHRIKGTLEKHVARALGPYVRKTPDADASQG